MAITLILHIANEEPIVGEVDELPTSTDSAIVLQNPRRRDGKDIPNLTSNSVTTVIYPMHRMTFVEVMPSEEEEKVFGVVRE
jgi:hypothetical protein